MTQLKLKDNTDTYDQFETLKEEKLIALHVKEHRCRKFLAFSFHYTRQHNTAFAGRQISM